MLASLAWLAGCGAPGERPSVVLITADTLRADRLGAYGYAKDTSPNLDAFAAAGMLFENALAHAPQTHTSFSSILTGHLPHETGVHDLAALPVEAETIAELLKRGGYTTHAVVSNHLLRNRDEWRNGQGWAQGFDTYDDEMRQREGVRLQPERIARDTTDRALEVLRGWSGEPLFLWVHYQDPHGPYAPPAGFAKAVAPRPTQRRLLRLNPSRSGAGGIPVQQRLRGSRNYFHYTWQYDGEIRYFDHELGRLFAALKDAGLYDTALILFTADHGEGLGEHDFYFSHVGRLHHVLTRVPLILRHGDRLSGRRDDFVQHVDLLPSIAAVVGLDTDPRLSGTDLRRPVPPGREIFAVVGSPIDHDGERASLVVDGLKLVKNRRTGQMRLYDLRTDPAEAHDLASDPARAAEVARLEQSLERIRQSDPLALGEPQADDLSPKEREILRALGYLE